MLRLDHLAASVVFARDGGRCRVCGGAGVMEWCHLRSRRYKATRWLPDNAFSAHHLCHMRTHASQSFNKEFLSANFTPQSLERLRVISINEPPPDIGVLEFRLKNALLSFQPLPSKLDYL